MRVLVVGGAGYIGSHMVKMLGDGGHDVVTYDNLSSGHRDAVLCGTFVEGDLADSALLGEVLKPDFDAVMHFASYIQVGESVRLPGKYYRNNFANTLNLLEAMVAQDIRNFIFSSTAAVYGNPQYQPLDEVHPRRPINPYGMSKSMVEDMLPDFDRAHGLRSACLRYFNAAGADPACALGERHEPETHLIPLNPPGCIGTQTACRCVWKGLLDTRRHLHSRLHSRAGSLQGAPSCTGNPSCRGREHCLQPRERGRIFGAGRHRCGTPGYRQTDPVGGCCEASW